MNTSAMAIDAAQNRLEARKNAGIKAALDKLQQRQLGDALVIFGYVFEDGIDLPAERVASVLIEVANTLITVFEFDDTDGRAPAAYHFLETVGREAAEVIAGLLELANFPNGNENPTVLSEPIMLAYAGSLSAAGRHDAAIRILARLLDKSPERLPLSHAMATALRRKSAHRHGRLRTIFDSLERPSYKIEHYFDLYERHLGKFIGKRPKILEIGTKYGGSAEMWRKYFGQGTIVYGVDIAPECEETDYLKLFVGDQGSHEFWDRNFADKTDFFDIVIDDGSHDNPHQIVTLLNCYNMIKDDGVYLCEDTHTSYYFGVRVNDGGYKHPGSFTEFCKNIIDVLSSEHAKYAIGVGPFDGPQVPASLVSKFNKVQGLHFYDSIIVIDKGERLKFDHALHVPSN